ncbi:MAG: tripartite tricarboxylate transporter substrate binding protein [Betaproteobacteria bacterium]|nr:tripartite tricarboxylate transporter substrate binding protein [Betaproteobacteria bacterium]
MNAIRRVATACIAVLALTCAFGALAQSGADSYPVKPIRMIVPLAAGGPSDTMARILAHKLTEVIGQNVIVDNRPGASGIVGTEIGARSPADGYTIVLVSNTIAVNPAIFRKIPYEFDKDLMAVSLLAATPYLLTVHPSLPVKSVKELIALAKARPGQLNHASGGAGTGPHLALEIFAQRSGIRIEQIVYRGGGPAMIDFLAGHTQVYFSNMVTAMPQVRAGKMRPLAVSSLTRSPAMPEIPTLAESGLPDFDEGGQHGVIAPMGISKEILARLHGAIVAAIRNPEIVKRLADEGSVVVASTPEEYRARILRDTAKSIEIVRSMNLKLE